MERISRPEDIGTENEGKVYEVDWYEAMRLVEDGKALWADTIPDAMKTKIKTTPMKRYECENCQAILDFPIYAKVSAKCCKKPSLVLIAIQKTEEELKEDLLKAFGFIKQIIGVYMDMPKEKIELVALWILGTYFHDSFNTYPYLFLNAMKGSGKTRLLKLISALCYKGNGKVYTGARETLLFRTPQHHTLVFDEMESITSKDKEVFREYLNACYKKGATVSRAKKVKTSQEENYVMEDFQPYKPLVMANIRGMDEVLGDRCITLILEKSDESKTIKLIEDFDSSPQIGQLKELLETVSSVSREILMKNNYIYLWNCYISPKYALFLNISIYPQNATNTTYTTSLEKPLLTKEKEEFFSKINDSGLDGRNLELFFPLLVMIDWIDRQATDKFVEIAKIMVDDKKREEYAESSDILLYQHVAHASSVYDFIPLREFTRGFKEFFGSDNENKWINERWMGRALKRLDLLLDRRKVNGRREVRLNSPKAKDKLKMFQAEEKKDE